MKVNKLTHRVFQIYALTILAGSLMSSMLLSSILTGVKILFSAFAVSLLITAILNLPNVPILYLGLKYIYGNAKDEREKRYYFVYLWLVLGLIPLLVLSSLWAARVLSFNPKSLLLIMPYILSFLFFIFRINYKFDRIYPPDFSRNRDISEDILDDGF